MDINLVKKCKCKMTTSQSTTPFFLFLPSFPSFSLSPSPSLFTPSFFSSPNQIFSFPPSFFPSVTSKKVPFLARTPEKTMLVDNSEFHLTIISFFLLHIQTYHYHTLSPTTATTIHSDTHTATKSHTQPHIAKHGHTRPPQRTFHSNGLTTITERASHHNETSTRNNTPPSPLPGSVERTHARKINK